MTDRRLLGLAASDCRSRVEALPPFPSPDGDNAALMQLLNEASQLLCLWLGEANQQGPRPTLNLEPATAPDQLGRSSDELLADLSGLMAGSFRPNHPGSLAHLDPPPLNLSIAADLIAAGLNNNLLAEELSPALTRLERRLCRWLAETLGLGESASGVPCSGGSLSNLMALVCARDAAGLRNDNQAVVICGASAHVSLDKAIAVMGLKKDALWRLPLDGSGRLPPEAVDQAIQTARQQSRFPIAVVATAGTTIQGQVDPLQPLAQVCRQAGVWLHVDGAIGAVCGLVASQRWRVAGLEAADSVTLNPQKLLGVTKPSSLLLLRNGEHLQRSFGTGLPYMECGSGAQGGELGLQGTRGAEVLKLWLSLHHLGMQGIADLLDGAFSRAAELRRLLQPQPLMLLPGCLHLVSFTSKASDRSAWRDRTHRQLLENELWLSRPDLDGEPLLKAVLGNPFTKTCQLEQLTRVVVANLQQ
jgi:sulfinoalanine decarboxylase